MTGSTVGYGDFSLQTVTGQLWSIVVILFAVGAVAALITDYTYRKQMKATKGRASYDSLAEAKHVIVKADRDHETMLAAMVAARKNATGSVCWRPIPTFRFRRVATLHS